MTANRHHDLREEDHMFEGCEAYAVFPIVDIPQSKFDDLIRSAREHDPPWEGTALRVITKRPFLPFKDYKRISALGDVRTPFLESQYKGKTIAELRTMFKEAFEEKEHGWSTTCFAVLDERLLKDSTVFLASANDPDDPLVLNYRAESAIALAILLTFDANQFFAIYPDHDPDLVFTKQDYNDIGGGQYPWGWAAQTARHKGVHKDLRDSTGQVMATTMDSLMSFLSWKGQMVDLPVNSPGDSR